MANIQDPAAGREAAYLSRFPRAAAMIESFLTQHACPGGSLAVTHIGELIMNRAFGAFTYDAGSPRVTPQTVFDLASLTKVLATTPMAMFLYERGTLDIDAPIAEAVPDFLTGDSRRERVTYRMLLAHSSGLPAYARLFAEVDTRGELLQRCFTMPLEAEPGARVEYSDIGFIILGEALERIAGEKLDSFCQREIFKPLKMAHTGFLPPVSARHEIPPTEWDHDFRKRVIQGEVHDENAWVLGGVAGHAGLFAPAVDVARFALSMLRGGSPVFRPETVSLFTQREHSPAGTTRALGWDTPSGASQSGRYFSHNAYGHLGFTGTSLWVDPEKDVSITLLTNRTWPDRSSQLIKQFRPALHDAILESLELV